MNPPQGQWQQTYERSNNAGPVHMPGDVMYKTEPAPSEIGEQLNMLSSALDALESIRGDVHTRLEIVSRGLPPEAKGQTSAPTPVLGSSLARTLEQMRHRIAAVSDGLEAEMHALALP